MEEEEQDNKVLAKKLRDTIKTLWERLQIDQSEREYFCATYTDDKPSTIKAVSALLFVLLPVLLPPILESVECRASMLKIGSNQTSDLTKMYTRCSALLSYGTDWLARYPDNVGYQVMVLMAWSPKV